MLSTYVYLAVEIDHLLELLLEKWQGLEVLT